MNDVKKDWIYYGFISGLVLYIISAPFSISLSETGLGIMILFTILNLLFGNIRFKTPTIFNYFFIGFVLIYIISTLTSIDISLSYGIFRKLLLIMMVYVVFMNVKNIKVIKDIFFILIIFAGISATYSLIKFAIEYSQLEVSMVDALFPVRTKGTFGHYMTYSGVMMIMISIILPVVLFGERGDRKRWIFLIPLLFCTVSIVLGFSRNAWVGLFAAIFLMFLLRKPKLIFLLIVLSVIGVILAPSGIQERALSMFNKKDLTVNSRIEMWKWGFKVIKKHPLTGIGYRCIKVEKHREEYGLSDFLKEEIGHLHNNYIQFAVENGIIGLIMLLWFIFGILKYLYISYRKSRKEYSTFESNLFLGILCAFAGFVCAGFFEQNFRDSEVIMLIYLLIGFVFTINRIRKESEVQLNVEKL